MRKLNVFVVVSLILAMIAGFVCFSGTAYADSEVIFPDPALNASVCAAVGISYGEPIMQSELSTLTTLSSGALGIINLTGLQNATNLQTLTLSDNNITNLSSLQSLVNLNLLSLALNPNLSDIYSLRFLTSITGLSLGNCNITNITPLSSTLHISYLDLRNNRVSDILPLSGLSVLGTLLLSDNGIVNTTTLLSLPSLGGLVISTNPLDSNSFTYVIPTLLGAGVFVTNDTPYILTYIAGIGGTLSGINPQYVGPNYNGTSITAVPNSNYKFQNWSDGSTQNPRIDTNITADLTVTANFVSLVPVSVITMTNIIAIVLGAVIIFLLLGFAYVEIKDNGFSEALGLTFMGILGIIVLEFVIIACL